MEVVFVDSQKRQNIVSSLFYRNFMLGATHVEHRLLCSDTHAPFCTKTLTPAVVC